MNIKVKWLRNQLMSLKLDGMIVSNPVNVKYLTGLEEEGILIIAPKENIFITDSRYIESVNRKLTIDDEIIAYDTKKMTKYDYEGIFMICENIGFEERYITYEQYQNYLQTYQVNLVETECLIENQRIVKEEQEIACIQKACEITDSAFEYIIKHIRKGMTEKEIAFEIEKFMLLNGADKLAFETIVASGTNSSMPHAVPTNRRIITGDIIQFDMGCQYKGYASDLSRVVFVEDMADEYEAVYDFVLEQQEKIQKALKDGSNIKSVIKNREADYQLKNFPIMHAFGHGVGLDIHELPFLKSNQDCTLRENSVIAIEPGVYFPGSFGIRIEDTYQVTKNGCINLTKCVKDKTIIHLLEERA